MKHLSSVVLAAAIVAAGVTACFKDPTSGLRNGAARIELSRTAITLRTGDSLAIQAELKDEQGNVLNAAALTWSTDNAAVASVRVDSIPIPGPAFSRGFVLANAAAGGVAHVTVTDGSLSSTFRVLVLPAQLTALAAATFTGTLSRDTVISFLPGGVIVRDTFTARDTVIFTTTAGSNLTFDSTASTVSFGPTKAIILSRTATTIKVVARMGPFHGRPWVTNLFWAGPAEVGIVAIDSLQGDLIAVSRPRFNGTATVASGLVMTITAPANLAFRTAAPLTGATLHGVPVSVITRSATQLVVSDTALADSIGFTGGVVVTNTDYTTTANGVIRFDSLWTNSNNTIQQVVLPGTITQPAGLLDTIVVAVPGGGLNTNSGLTIGGIAAWVVYQSATHDTLMAIARFPGNVQAYSVSNVTLGGVTFPSLAPRGKTVSIPISPTHEANEPANDAPGAVVIDLSTATSAATPFVVFGSVDGDGNGLGADADDFFAFTTTVVKTITIQLQFAGTGAGGITNPDLDLLVCNAACTAFVATSGATAAQPENTVLTNRAAGTYNIYVNGWDTGSATRPYKLIVYTN